MKFALKPMAFAVLMAIAQLTGVAYAAAGKAAAINTSARSPLAVKEDIAQLKQDAAALSRDEEQLRAHRMKLQSDTREGRMVAESKDAEKLYQDRMYLKGEQKDVAADKPSSLQKQYDEVALRFEEKQLKADKATLMRDTWEGRMAAESGDAEEVYHDQQFVKGERKDFLTDAAKLQADRKG